MYEGPLVFNGEQGIWHKLMFPSRPGAKVVNTSCYGPNNLEGGGIQVVGSYNIEINGIQKDSKGASITTLGFLYEGPIDGSGEWTTLSPNSLVPENVPIP